MENAHSTITERTPFASPAPSRAPTPLGKFRSAFSEEFLPFYAQSRSQSRARPGRKFSQDEASHDGHPTNRSASRRTRFVVEKDTPVASVQEKSSPVVDQVLLTGEELGENARIWQIYIDEAAKADTAMTDGWNRSMDVLLVFIGLFSAVLTTFIIQSYQDMATNPTDATNALLLELILLQFNNSDGASRASAIVRDSKPSQEIHYVNGFWFAALACSLSTALISMLAKQWLQAYTPVASGSPRYRARNRHARYIQLQAWRVPAIINALPLMLHIALLLFFVGLIILLWSVDIRITIATWVIVAFSYFFYLVSIWLPLQYPDCPYHHPVSDHIRKWLQGKSRKSGTYTKLRAMNWMEVATVTPPASQADYNGRLDAAALIWLFTKSTDSDVVSAALQAISGLPRDFSAVHLLRDAGALHLIEQEFEKCFYKDTTVDLQWHLVDVEKASLYCRAWINLTRGTSEQWPLEIVEPLWLLQDVKTYPEAAAIASCTVALSSLDSHISQWELLSYLSRCTSGELQLSQATQCCILDSIIECMVRWEMPSAVIEQTNVRAVPTLLRMLHLTEDLPSSELQCASTLALYVITQNGPFNLEDYRSEDRRRAEYCQLLIKALAVLIDSPERFGVTEDLIDIAAKQFCRLAPSVVAQSERFPQPLKKTVRSSLTQLYVERRIGAGIIPDVLLADVLHLLYPPLLVPENQRAPLVSILVENLRTPAPNPDITSWSIRLLEILVANCTPPVIAAFTESQGIPAILRVAKAGSEDSRRLQIESFRTLFTFIRNVATQHQFRTHLQNTEEPNAHIDTIFQSEFLEVLCSFITRRRWWLFEISGDWMPTLFRLCKLRPDEPVWATVVRVFKDFANRNFGEDGYMETIALLDVMAAITNNDNTEDEDDGRARFQMQGRQFRGFSVLNRPANRVV
ncbi:hypothetical protein L218DRAFT_1072754 [Marasmius fiardii PR-910]|nr:hypothetical protein L218DRAFT_1072754 [Marasmius fiardii PR-910]